MTTTRLHRSEVRAQLDKLRRAHDLTVTARRKWTYGSPELKFGSSTLGTTEVFGRLLLGSSEVWPAPRPALRNSTARTTPTSSRMLTAPWACPSWVGRPGA